MATEFTTAEWHKRAPFLRNIIAHHECDGSCGHVFLCRGEPALAPRASDFGGDFSCGRYVGGCMGGSDDNRCASCWCRKERANGRL